MMKILNLQDAYLNSFEKRIKGRYITPKKIAPLLENLPSEIFNKEQLGVSENGLPIFKITIGKGTKRILLWSQMHGNESTATKALFDLFQFIQFTPQNYQQVLQEILSKCTLCIIPMLNPDGSILFTRENAKGIDLNRDAVAQQAVESRLLRKVLEKFSPEYCFNLHEQRSIFNVEGTSYPATLSFLAPSEDESRALTEGRKRTMEVIVAINNALQSYIPMQIGRYTDEFYPTATGDNFQKMGYHTILVESGHYKDDYSREKVREMTFYALFYGIRHIALAEEKVNYKLYFDIPNNDKKYLDIIYKNVCIDGKLTSVGIQYKFKVTNDKLLRYSHIEIKGDVSLYTANTVINAKNKSLEELHLTDLVDFEE